MTKHEPDAQHDEQSGDTWETIDVPEFGYSVQLPAGWQRRDPDLTNSPWETARFADPGDRRHSLIVFRSPVQPGSEATVVAERVRNTLAASMFTDFTMRPIPFAGQPGARLDCLRHDAGRVWAVTQYFAVREASSFCLGFGTSAPAKENRALTGSSIAWTPIPER